MITSWEKAKEMAANAEQGGIFVRLKSDGDKVVGAFVGNPCARQTHWTETGTVECEGEGCPHCEKRKPSMKVSLNFYVPAEGKMKVIEGGVVWFKDVVKVREKYGFDQWLFEIERHGEAGNKKTTYSILPETKMDEEVKERIALAELHDLESIGKGDKEDSSGEMPAYNDDGFVSAAIRGELTAELKMQPQENVDKFLRAFGIQKVSQLLAKDEAKARAFIKSFGKKQQAEISPWDD